MKDWLFRHCIAAASLAAILALAGCATISEYTQVTVGGPQYPPNNPDYVQILGTAPKQPQQRLGQIILAIYGQPSRQRLEKRLREAAARLGANAVFVVRDRTHIFPIVYVDWWGPGVVNEDVRRDIVAEAVRL